MGKLIKTKGNIFLLVMIGALVLSSCILVEEPTPAPPTSTPTPADIIIPPTATPKETSTDEPATAEPTETLPANTATATHTATTIPTSTATASPSPTATHTQTATPYPISLQPGTPAYIKNFAYPASGCAWAGAAGQVFGESGAPLINLVVLVSGTYNGKTVNAVGVTGTVTGDIYGPGGYEIKFGDKALSTAGKLTIQVFNLEGLPLSRAFPFDTSSACDENLVVINFTQ